jgi:hypothetical protein
MVMLVQVSAPPQVMSLTLSPIEDSLNALVGGEAMRLHDEPDNGFVTPYLEGKGSWSKQGHVLVAR